MSKCSAQLLVSDRCRPFCYLGGGPLQINEEIADAEAGDMQTILEGGDRG